jgi:hypothetical protein
MKFDARLKKPAGLHLHIVPVGYAQNFAIVNQFEAVYIPVSSQHAFVDWPIRIETPPAVLCCRSPSKVAVADNHDQLNWGN